MTADWSISLGGQFNRRTEDGSLVFWRKGLTIWIIVWKNDNGQTVTHRMTRIRGDVSLAAYDILEEQHGSTSGLAYRLLEDAEDERAPAFHGFSVADVGHVQLAVYFNDETAVASAKAIWRSIRCRN